MRAVTLSLVLLLVPAVGCSATNNSLFTTSGAGGSGSGAGASVGTSGTGASGMGGTGVGTSGTGGGLGLGGAIGVGGGTGTGCTTAEELVYVFDTDNNIYSFNPAAVTMTPPQNPFTLLATANCGMDANSMAIDRNLVAWLNFDEGNGAIYTFDLNTNGPCKPSGIHLPSGFNQVGMGFSADVAGGTAETLYLDGIGGTSGLAKVDMSTLDLVMLGDFSPDPKLEGQSCELTGTGNALLYGYFTTSPYVRVAQIDKTNGTIVSGSDHMLNGVTTPSDWAFSFWGGSFYLYAAPGNNFTGNSSVIKYDPIAGTVDMTFIADVGFTIIGAGVSTCAPITPPT